MQDADWVHCSPPSALSMQPPRVLRVPQDEVTPPFCTPGLTRCASASSRVHGADGRTTADARATPNTSQHLSLSTCVALAVHRLNVSGPADLACVNQLTELLDLLPLDERVVEFIRCDTLVDPWPTVPPSRARRDYITAWRCWRAQLFQRSEAARRETMTRLVLTRLRRTVGVEPATRGISQLGSVANAVVE